MKSVEAIQVEAIQSAQIPGHSRAAKLRYLNTNNWISNHFCQRLDTQQSQSTNPQIEKMKERFVAGWGAIDLVGTPEQVVQQFQQLSDAGMDGAMLGVLDYVPELEHFNEKAMPLLREAGLRH